MDLREDLIIFVDSITEKAKNIIRDTGNLIPIVFGKVSGKIHGTLILSFGADPSPNIKEKINNYRTIKADWIVIMLVGRMRINPDFDLKNYKRGMLQTSPRIANALVIQGSTRDGFKYIRIFEIVEMEENYEFDEVKFSELGKITLEGELLPEPW